MVRGPFPHAGNAADDQDCLNTVDRWLVGGITKHLDACIAQQRWPDASATELKEAWQDQFGKIPGGGHVERGSGWRAWYPDDTTLDSRTVQWKDVPDGIVLAVSYLGPMRWMAQGLDPFWITRDGHVHDARTHYHDEHTNPRWLSVDPAVEKQGVWVADEDMRRIRWLATLSFIL